MIFVPFHLNVFKILCTFKIDNFHSKSDDACFTDFALKNVIFLAIFVFIFIVTLHIKLVFSVTTLETSL